MRIAVIVDLYVINQADVIDLGRLTKIRSNFLEVAGTPRKRNFCFVQAQKNQNYLNYGELCISSTKILYSREGIRIDKV